MATPDELIHVSKDYQYPQTSPTEREPDIRMSRWKYTKAPRDLNLNLSKLLDVTTGLQDKKEHIKRRFFF